MRDQWRLAKETPTNDVGNEDVDDEGKIQLEEGDEGLVDVVEAEEKDKDSTRETSSKAEEVEDTPHVRLLESCMHGSHSMYVV